MTGYRNDQFYNLGSTESGETSPYTVNGRTRAGIVIKDAANPKFVYPDREVRTVDLKTGKWDTTPLKRGYIRTLTTFGGGQNIPIRKCQFQFNPATLRQNVSQMQNVLNTLQQDPAQFAQPVPGNVQFGFELLFDRSMELNNQVYTTVSTENPWYTNDPSQVGVLRDLAALFDVIGQGLTSDAIAAAQSTLEAQVNTEANATADSEGNISAETGADRDKAISNLPQFLQMNAANSAFLMPIPVRVVFSSLYIVEGFITSTDVTFTKFNTNMVPMQCAVSLTMEAKYIGFAQKNTFMTWAVEERAKAEKAAIKEENDRLAAIYAAYSKVLGKMEVGVVSASTDYEDEGFTLSDGSTVYSLFDAYPGYFGIGIRLPSASGKNDEVGKLFTDIADIESPPFIIAFAEMDVYGPFNPLVNFRSDLASYAKANGRLLFSGKLMPTNAWNGSAQTADEWNKMVKSGVVSLDQFTTKSGYRSGPAAPYDGEAKAHIVRISGKVQTKIDGQHVVGKGERWFYVAPGSANTCSTTIGINWPTFTPQAVPGESTSSSTDSSGGGTVAPDNAATAPKPAGGSSSVGKPRPVKVV